MDNQERNSFIELRSINLNRYTKEKMNLTYLSWADAWDVIKQYDPDATQTVHTRNVKTEEIKRNESGDTVTVAYENNVPYFTDGKTCWVEVDVTIKGKTYTEIFPVMDNRNQAVRLTSITTVDVNKAIQRAFVKACARHGLGLYIYRGEDLPEDDKLSLAKAQAAVSDGSIQELVKKITTAEIFNEYKDKLTSLIKKIEGDPLKDQILAIIPKYQTKRVSAFVYPTDAPILAASYLFLSTYFNGNN